MKTEENTKRVTSFVELCEEMMDIVKGKDKYKSRLEEIYSIDFYWKSESLNREIREIKEKSRAENTYNFELGFITEVVYEGNNTESVLCQPDTILQLRTERESSGLIGRIRIKPHNEECLWIGIEKFPPTLFSKSVENIKTLHGYNFDLTLISKNYPITLYKGLNHLKDTTIASLAPHSYIIGYDSEEARLSLRKRLETIPNDIIENYLS